MLSLRVTTCKTQQVWRHIFTLLSKYGSTPDWASSLKTSSLGAGDVFYFIIYNIFLFSWQDAQRGSCSTAEFILTRPDFSWIACNNQLVFYFDGPFLRSSQFICVQPLTCRSCRQIPGCFDAEKSFHVRWYFFQNCVQRSKKQNKTKSRVWSVITLAKESSDFSTWI